MMLFAAAFVCCNVEYDTVGEYSDNRAAVRLKDKWGFIDESGKEIISLQYDDVKPFKRGFAQVQLNGKWGYIDIQGEKIIPCRYDTIFSFSHPPLLYTGIAEARLNGKWGFIDIHGKEIITCRYDEIYSFLRPPTSDTGIVKVKLNGKYGFIDIHEKEIIPCRYDEIFPFYVYGIAKAQLNGKYGLIDKNGKEIISFKCDILFDRGNDQIYVTSDDESFFINSQGQRLNIKTGIMAISNYSRRANRFDLVDAKTGKKLVYHTLFMNNAKVVRKNCVIEHNQEKAQFVLAKGSRQKSEDSVCSILFYNARRLVSMHIKTHSKAITVSLNFMNYYDLDNGVLRGYTPGHEDEDSDSD
jgi:hypothetical protein